MNDIKWIKVLADVCLFFRWPLLFGGIFLLIAGLQLALTGYIGSEDVGFVYVPDYGRIIASIGLMAIGIFNVRIFTQSS